jgi:hypothetical protein
MAKGGSLDVMEGDRGALSGQVWSMAFKRDSPLAKRPFGRASHVALPIAPVTNRSQ